MPEMDGFLGGHVHWSVVVLVVVGAVLLVKLLSLLDNPRTRLRGVVLLLLALLTLGWFYGGVHVQMDRPARESRQAAIEIPLPPGYERDEARSQVADSQPNRNQDTVVITPPDKAEAGKPADDRISVKVETDQGTGKGTIIYIKADRMLEALGKNFLDKDRLADIGRSAVFEALAKSLDKDRFVDIGRSVMIEAIAKNLMDAARQSTGKDAGPAKPAAPAATQTSAAASAPAAPGGSARTSLTAKAVATVPSKPSQVVAVKKAPRDPGMPGKPAAPPLPPGYAAPLDDASVETVEADGVTAADSKASLDDELEKAFARYVERQGFETAEEVRFPAGEIRNFILPGSQVQKDKQSSTLGAIIHTSVLVDFGRAYQRYCLPRRLWYLGGGLGAVFLLLSVVYGYLKIDLATAGAYRWRLRLAATAILLGTAAAAVAFLT